MMLFTFIIRNDKIAIGIVRDGALAGSASISTDTKRTADEYAVLLKNILDFQGFSASQFDGAICASVVPAITDVLREAVHRLLGHRPHLIGSGIKTGLTITTENPAELGGDMVASAVGAIGKYPTPAILVDCGTAITFSLLDEDGRFIGCAIAPGLSLSASALSDTAGLLPQVSHGAPKSVIGKNTAESLRAGTVLGFASMVDGMLDRIEEAHGTVKTTLLSGEDADFLLPHLRHTAVKDNTLAPLGLATIYQKNKRK